MLTIYEQIQEAIDFAEANLFEEPKLSSAADAACMSERSFHRYFPALTGYSFGEYVRKRRLSEALELLLRSDASVLEVALDAGYDSHEAFTRAFKREFGAPPLRFRNNNLSAARTDKLKLVGEVIMGVLTTSLPAMTAACFDGFRPEPERAAQHQLEEWLARHPEVARSYRSFAHNIDAAGRLSHQPDNDGYRAQCRVDGAEGRGIWLTRQDIRNWQRRNRQNRRFRRPHSN